MSNILIPKIRGAKIPDGWRSFLNDPGRYGWRSTIGPGDWRAFLADPKKHWRDGRSAKETACNWESADGLPSEIAELFDKRPELLFAIPEHKVPMPARGGVSRSDVFALMYSDDQLIAMAVEGVYEENFGDLVGGWLAKGGQNRYDRLGGICKLLEIDDAPGHLRYQLFHRTASAIIEARRFKADMAVVIIQSFSPGHMWHQDFAKFCSYLGVGSERKSLHYKTLSDGLPLGFAWVTSQMRPNKS